MTYYNWLRGEIKVKFHGFRCVGIILVGVAFFLVFVMQSFRISDYVTMVSAFFFAWFLAAVFLSLER